MKRSMYIWGLLIGLGLPALGQQNFASISIGTSIPFGAYAQSGELGSMGYARTGGAIKFEAGYFPVSYLGIGGSFSFGSNYASGDSISKDLLTYLNGLPSGIIDIPEEAQIDHISGFWNYINLFIGPHFSARLSQRFYLDVHALTGASIIRPPDQELIISWDGQSLQSQSPRNRVSLGIMLGAGMRFRLNSSIALKMAADYYQSKARNTYRFSFPQSLSDDIPPIDAEFRLQTIEITAGLAYAF